MTLCVSSSRTFSSFSLLSAFFLQFRPPPMPPSHNRVVARWASRPSVDKAKPPTHSCSHCFWGVANNFLCHFIDNYSGISFVKIKKLFTKRKSKRPQKWKSFRVLWVYFLNNMITIFYKNTFKELKLWLVTPVEAIHPVKIYLVCDWCKVIFAHGLRNLFFVLFLFLREGLAPFAAPQCGPLLLLAFLRPLVPELWGYPSSTGSPVFPLPL